VESVSDGTPVDWEREKRDQPSLRASLEGLSILERIRDLYRGPAGAAAGTAEASADDDTRSAGPANAAQAPPLFTWGPLRVLEKVGEGHWGVVYRAFEPTLETEVALKMLKEEVSRDAASVDRFISEARRLARVRHENVLTVHGADRHEGRVGMWTEFLRGQSLEKYLAAQGPLSAREATNIGLDLCRALSAVHGAGLAHRDIKASNVMRAEGGRIVLMDFGSVGDLPRPGALEATRNIHGTPVTMAPEQLRGQIAGPATDIYGVGVLLYNLTTRRYPVEAKDLPELVRRHENRDYVPLRDRRPDLPYGFLRVVERALSPDPADRYPSAGAMEQALHAALAPERRTLRERVAENTGLLAAAAVLVAAVIVLSQLPRQPGSVEGRPSPAPGSGGAIVPGGTAKPVAPPADVALSASASLHRLENSREVPVPEGGRIRPGDELALRVKGTERMNVYVLNEDEEGNVYVLFPIPGLEPRNPLRPDRTYRLPGDGPDSSIYWTVTSPGGRESIIAIASRTPLEEIDHVLAEFPTATRGQPVTYRKLPLDAMRRLRGIGGLAAEPKRPAAEIHEVIDDMMRALESRRDRTGDVWIWKADLENPGPRA
jgi:serine/threonine protein kinase